MTWYLFKTMVRVIKIARKILTGDSTSKIENVNFIITFNITGPIILKIEKHLGPQKALIGLLGPVKAEGLYKI